MTQLRLPPLPTIRDLLRLYRLRALKQLSQNFLLDLRLTDKIVKVAGGPKYLEGTEVCEVGPGPGPITRSILNTGVKKLIVIEKDERFLPTLQLLADAAPGRLDIVLGDILSFNMSQIFSPELRKMDWKDNSPPIHIIGNLPFSVSTPLIIRWLKDISERRNAWSYGRVKMTLTFQEEVAERMVAQEGDRQRCRLSVMCQSWCHVVHKFTIPGRAFLPKPDVNVGVVHLVPRTQPLMNAPFPVVEKFVRTLFSFRQKYCIRGIERLFPIILRDVLASELITKSGVNPKAKPYQLQLEEIVRMTDVYWDMCQQTPKILDYNHRSPASEKVENDWIESLCVECEDDIDSKVQLLT